MACFVEINHVIPLLNFAAYWKSTNSEACTKKLSQILANNIDKGGGGLDSEFM